MYVCVCMYAYIGSYVSLSAMLTFNYITTCVVVGSSVLRLCYCVLSMCVR